jgi:2,5-diamino-6-(ribosylamino)-4(3H)-pyrimidinone 5'-phosphate reductase
MSVDGRLDWFAGDLEQYYRVAHNWPSDAILTTSNTILAALSSEPSIPEDDESIPTPVPEPGDSRPLLVVVDSRGRFRHWNWLRGMPYWRDGVALCSRATPQSHLEYLDRQEVDAVIAGEDRVDLQAALEELNARYGVQLVRADSGGTLNGLLLRAGMVTELSVLVQPTLVGGRSPRSLFVAPDLEDEQSVIPLRLLRVEKLEGDVVWLHYMLDGKTYQDKETIYAN